MVVSFPHYFILFVILSLCLFVGIAESEELYSTCAPIAFTGPGNIALSGNIIVPSGYPDDPCFSFASGSNYTFDGRGFSITYPKNNTRNAAIEIYGSLFLSNIILVNAHISLAAEIHADNITITATNGIITNNETAQVNVRNSFFHVSFAFFGSATSFVFSNNSITAALTGISVTSYTLVQIDNNKIRCDEIGIQISAPPSVIMVNNNDIEISPQIKGTGMKITCTSSSGQLAVSNNIVTVTHHSYLDACPPAVGYFISMCRGTLLNNTATFFMSDYRPCNLYPQYGGIHIQNSENITIDNAHVSLCPFYSSNPLNYNNGLTYNFGIYFTNTQRPTVKNSLIENIYGLSMRAANGGDINAVNGGDAIGIIIDNNNITATIVNNTIRNVIGGRAAVFYESQSKDYQNLGGNVYGVKVFGPYTMTGNTLDNLVGGDGIQVPNAKMQLCTGGQAFAFEPASNENLGNNTVNLSTISNGGLCTFNSIGLNISECGYIDELINSVVYLSPLFLYTSSSCIHISYADNVTIIGQETIIRCDSLCSSNFGIIIDQAHKVTIQDIAFQGPGIFLKASEKGVIVKNNNFSYSYQAISIEPLSDGGAVSIDQNSFDYINGPVIHVGNFHSLSVSGNNISNIPANGEIFGNTSFINFARNKITKWGGKQISLSARNGYIVRNTIYDTTVTEDTFFNIRVTDSSSTLQINNNTIELIERPANQILTILGIACDNKNSVVEYSQNIIRDIKYGCASARAVRILQCNFVAFNSSVTNMRTNNIVCNKVRVITPLVIRQSQASLNNIIFASIQTPMFSATSTPLNFDGIDSYKSFIAGAIIVNSQVSITDSHFYDFNGPETEGCDSCENTAGGFVLGFLVMGSGLNVSRSLFTGFRGGKGGDINNTTLPSNYTTSGGSVYGFFLYNQSSVIVEHSNFTNLLLGSNGLAASNTASTCSSEAKLSRGEGDVTLTNVVFENSTCFIESIPISACGDYNGENINYHLIKSITFSSACIRISNSRNLVIHGNGYYLSGINSAGIRVDQSDNIKITGVNFNASSLFVASTMGSLQITNCHFTNLNGYCINVPNAPSLLLLVTLSYFEKCNTGIGFGGTSTRVVLDNNHFNNSWIGISLAQPQEVIISRNTIENTFYGLNVVANRANISQNKIIRSGSIKPFKISVYENSIIEHNTVSETESELNFNGYDITCNGAPLVFENNKLINVIANGTVLGILCQYCDVQLRNNLVKNIVCKQSNFNSVAGIVIKNCNGNANNNTVEDLTASSVYIRGFQVANSTFIIKDLYISNIKGSDTPACNTCFNTEGNDVYGLVVSDMSSVQAYNVIMKNIRAGSAGENTGDIAKANTNTGGSVYGFKIDSNSALTIYDPLMMDFVAGDGAFSYGDFPPEYCRGGLVYGISQCDSDSSCIEIPISLTNFRNFTNGKNCYGVPVPVVFSSSPSVTQGERITISGSNFIPNFASYYVSISKTNIDSFVNCTRVTVESAATISCDSPAGSGSNYSILVSAIGVSATKTNAFSYRRPEVLSASPTGPSGGVITINGRNFGNNASLVNVIAGRAFKCEEVSIIVDHTIIACHVSSPPTDTSYIATHLTMTVDGLTNIDLNRAFRTPEVSLCDRACDPRQTCVIDTSGFPQCGPCPVGTYFSPRLVCELLCGDGFCNSSILETCISCPQDCNASTCAGSCGDAVCGAGETCSNCFEDCGACVIPCSPSPNCNGHGTCSSGLCVCYDRWSGPSCNIPQTQPINVTVNGTSPGIAVGSPSLGNFKYFISINKIDEVTPNGNVERTFSISSVNFTLNTLPTGKNILFNYSTELSNRALVNVLVYQFGEPLSNIDFANNTYTYKQNTLKLSVQVIGWPFLSLQNKLHINLNSEMQDTQNVCNNKDLDEQGNVKWITVTFGETTLYGQFLDLAMVDGKTKRIAFMLNPDNTVTAILPNFWFYAEMDPSYSVLIGDDAIDQEVCGNKQEEEGNKRNKLLPLIIILPIVGAIAIAILLAIFVVPRVQVWWKLHKSKMQAVPNSDKEISMDRMRDVEIERAGQMSTTTSAGTFIVQL